MDWMLHPHTAYAVAYLDGIIFHREHVQRVATVLGAGLTANLKKCPVGQRDVQYLGYHLRDVQVCLQAEKTMAIASCPSPKAKKRGELVLEAC